MNFFVAAHVTQHAQLGSDQIESAVEECWLGSRPAIAFQGAVRDSIGNLHHEVFVSELSLNNGATHCSAQRRVTRTLDRNFPGLQGPRCWLAASPCGEFVYFLARDDRGTVQLHRVASSGLTPIDQITDLACSIEGQISLDPLGEYCSFLCDQMMTVVDLRSGRISFQSEKCDWLLSGAVHFASKGRLLCNGYVPSHSGLYLQVLCCDFDG
jgi:hypothetical protein